MLFFIEVFLKFITEDFWASSKDLAHSGVFYFVERPTAAGELKGERDLPRGRFAGLSLSFERLLPLLRPLLSADLQFEPDAFDDFFRLLELGSD